LPEGFKRIKQLSDPAIGGVDVVRGDVFPNLVEIELGSGTEDNRSRAWLPALLGFALQSGASCGRIHSFAAVESG
jgi:hypothetical protein